MPKSRLIHRVDPYPDELLIGFLMRVALRNHLVGPLELLQHLSGGKQMNLRFKDICVFLVKQPYKTIAKKPPKIVSKKPPIFT